MFKTLLGSVLGLLILSLTFQLPLAYADGAMLEISTTPPGATIWIDSQKVGTSPGLFETSSGNHTVKAEKEAYLAQSKTVTVSSGDIANMHLGLEKDPVYALKVQRRDTIKNYLATYGRYDATNREITTLQKKLKPQVSEINGQRLQDKIQPSLTRIPTREDYTTYNKKLSCMAVSVYTLMVFTTFGLMLLPPLCSEKTRKAYKKSFYSRKETIFDEQGYTAALKRATEHNAIAEKLAEEKNRTITESNHRLQLKLEAANKKIDSHNSSLKSKIKAIKRKTNFTQLELKLDRQAAKVISLSKRLGETLLLPANPDYADYAKKFRELQ